MFGGALAFLGGHCAVHFGMTALPGRIALLQWALLAVLATAARIVLRVPSVSYISKLIAMFTCGVLWSAVHAAWQLHHDLPSATQRTDTMLDGYVASIVEHAEFGQRFAIDVVEDRDADDRPALRRVELTWYDAPLTLHPGERWQLQTRLKPRQGFANPGGYDYEAQLFREGVGATGYVREGDNRRIASAGWRYPVLQFRAYIAQQLAAALPTARMLGIVQGLAIGETQAMSSEQWRVFANTGTTHLMAISGLHIAMVAMLFAWLVRRIARRLPLQQWGTNAIALECASGMSAAVLYSLLAGLSVPTQRTLVMLCVYFGMRWRRRQVASLQGFALALLGVLLVDPLAPLAAGFWLSFGAVVAIFIGFGGRMHIDSRPASRVRDYVTMQAVVTVGMTPLVVGAFGNVSLISPLVNLVVIPIFTVLLVPIILFGSVLVSVQVNLGAPLLQLASLILELLWPTWEWAASLPLALWHLPQLPWAMVMLLCAGCVLCIAPSAWVLRVAGVALCVPAATWAPPAPVPGGFELTLLDVGQGLAVVVRTRSHVLVYDTGPSFRSGRDTGELVVLPYLYSRGVRRIDMVVASHGDADHVGGLQSLLRGLPTARVLAGPSVQMLRSSQPPFERCAFGQSWRWDEVEFAVLHPGAQAVQSKTKDNDTSCVLTVRGRYGAATIFGDIEREGEMQLLREHRVQPADIAVVPHHGSRTSSTPALIEAVHAGYALIGAGAGNRWGFPKPDVLARWRERGARTFVTASGGAISVTVGEQGVETPRLHRVTRRRYWQPVPAAAENAATEGVAALGAGESW